MTHRYRSPAVAVVAGVLALTACSTRSDRPDLDGRWSAIAAPTVSSSSTPSATASAAPTESVPPAVGRELDELSRNLRDLTQAPSSREALPAMTDAMADTRAGVKVLRERAYGAEKSCAAVAEALSSARSNAARTTSAAATIRARNATRSALRSRGSATVERLVAAASGGSRTPAPAESAAVADARTTLAGAADQIARSGEAAADAVAAVRDLVATAEGVAVKAC
ncbi:MAG: hypothetical protein ACRCYX_13975 [Dermatophilaceae bacterium]